MWIGQGEVLENATPSQKRRLLKDDGRLLRARDLSLEVAVDPSDDPQERGLANPRWPKDGNPLPSGQLEANVAQHLSGAERLSPHIYAGHAVRQRRTRLSHGWRSAISTTSMTATNDRA